VANRYRYNELHDELGLGWYDYGARMYDPSIGRWNGVDASSEEYGGFSPYNYVLNNPLVLVDPDGRRTATAEEMRKFELAKGLATTVYQAEDGGSDDGGGDPKNQKKHEDGNIGHADDARTEEVQINGAGAQNIYDKFSQVATREREGIPISIPGEANPLTYWKRYYDRYRTGVYSPRQTVADAVGIGISGSFIPIQGASGSVTLLWIRGQGLDVVWAEGGGAGWDVSAGISLTLGYYSGKRPTFDSYKGLFQENSLGAGPVSIGYFQDIGQSQAGNYKFGRNWAGITFGAGASASFVSSFFSGSSQVTYTHIRSTREEN